MLTEDRTTARRRRTGERDEIKVAAAAVAI
jgi:hypothetical protein